MSAPTLIIGGGAAGLSAAATLATAGRDVVLVDRAPVPGGQAAAWACMATDRCQRCGLCLLHDVQVVVHGHEHIRRIGGAEVTAIDGSAGSFRATLAATGDAGGDVVADVEASAVVLATGFEPFDPRAGRPLGYGELDPVVTTVDLNRALLADDLSTLGFAGGDEKRIAFLQCVGSRDPAAGRGYCSQICCQGSLRAAQALLHRHPDWKITVFYIDLQVYGKMSRTKYSAAMERLRFVQGVPAEVLPAEDGAVGLVFQGDDGNVTQESFDGVVLAVGMTPRASTGPLAESLGLETGIGGFLKDEDLPEGVHAAGTCVAPSFLEGSLQAGRRAAARLLAAEDNAEVTAGRTVCVIGREDEGRVAAQALVAMGLEVTLVALGDGVAATPLEGAQVVAADGVDAIRGQLGSFVVTLSGAERTTVDAAGLVLAPGAALVAHVPGEILGVATQPLAELDEVGSNERIAFWLDSFDMAWRPSAAWALDAARRTTAAPGAKVSVLFRHVPLPGHDGQHRYDRAREAGVRFYRQTDEPVRESPEGDALIVSDAAAPEHPIRLPTDRLVIAETGEPGEPLLALTEAARVGLDDEGYAQRADVRLFPLRTERPGIWVLGNGRAETLTTELAVEADGLAADVAALLGDGERFTRASPAEIDEGSCVKCLTCVRVCPHRAIEPTAYGVPTISATACAECGTCVTTCPGEAITLHTAPARVEARAGTKIFACTNSGFPALRETGVDEGWLVQRVSCGGSVSELDVLQAVQAGAERVLVLCCHPGSCMHLDGESHCGARIPHVQQMLTSIGYPEGTLERVTLAPSEGDRLRNLLDAARAPKGGTP